jgi:23S rRNA pseudouridine2605 synthase
MKRARRAEARGEGQERLQRYLARAGFGSRRSCEALIQEGRVRVNGRTASKLGTKVTPGVDSVTCDGEPVTPHEEHVYLLVHKPGGVLTSLSDPERRPVVPDLLPRRGWPRLFPVGRLDYRTEGLLLLTNDGVLAHALMHPSFGVEREYLAKVRGSPTTSGLAKLEAGVVSMGERLRAERVRLVSSGADSSWLRLVVREGRYHAIRRMCEAIGHPVRRLKRVRFGTIVLGRLAKGAWRRLSAREVEGLRGSVARKTA